MNEEAAKALRAPFPDTAIGKLPRAGITLDYVGHAAVTDRLLEVDPEWAWEPVAFAEDGAPLIRYDGKNATLWIRLTVCGTTRYGVGSVGVNAFELEKQLIGDALRNAAMRFGVALDLWSKEEIHAPAPQGIDPQTGEVLPVGDVDALKPRELHGALAARGLDAAGTLEELRERLREAVGAVSAEGAPASGSGDQEPSPPVEAGDSPSPASPDPQPPQHGYDLWQRADLVAECKQLGLPYAQSMSRLVRELRAYDALHEDHAYMDGHEFRPF